MLFTTTKLLRYAFVNVNIYLFSNNGTEHVQSTEASSSQVKRANVFFFFLKRIIVIYSQKAREMRVYKIIQCRNARESDVEEASEREIEN